jgi:hypothetical protein
MGGDGRAEIAEGTAGGASSPSTLRRTRSNSPRKAWISARKPATRAKATTARMGTTNSRPARKRTSNARSGPSGYSFRTAPVMGTKRTGSTRRSS